MNGDCGGDEARAQITEVWGDNLEEEFARIRDVVERFQYVAMDTEFPGIVARPTGKVSEYNYQTVKYNVDLLKVIQLGLTFADSEGRLAAETSTWQFNFRFNLSEDMYAQDSIDFLKQSGVDFAEQQSRGIDVEQFGELIMSSGLVMNEQVKWISFHGCYDFGYLLKLLTCAPLPHSEAQFFELVHLFFPALYDIKFLLRSLPPHLYGQPNRGSASSSSSSLHQQQNSSSSSLQDGSSNSAGGGAGGGEGNGSGNGAAGGNGGGYGGGDGNNGGGGGIGRNGIAGTQESNSSNGCCSSSSSGSSLGGGSAGGGGVAGFNLAAAGGCSLQKIAEQLQVRRVGPQHQAGSDSLVTCRTFFRLVDLFFDNRVDDFFTFSGVIYGLGTNNIPKKKKPLQQEPAPRPPPSHLQQQQAQQQQQQAEQQQQQPQAQQQQQQTLLHQQQLQQAQAQHHNAQQHLQLQQQQQVHVHSQQQQQHGHLQQQASLGGGGHHIITPQQQQQTPSLQQSTMQLSQLHSQQQSQAAATVNGRSSNESRARLIGNNLVNDSLKQGRNSQQPLLPPGVKGSNSVPAGGAAAAATGRTGGGAAARRLAPGGAAGGGGGGGGGAEVAAGAAVGAGGAGAAAMNSRVLCGEDVGRLLGENVHVVATAAAAARAGGGVLQQQQALSFDGEGGALLVLPHSGNAHAAELQQHAHDLQANNGTGAMLLSQQAAVLHHHHHHVAAVAAAEDAAAAAAAEDHLQQRLNHSSHSSGSHPDLHHPLSGSAALSNSAMLRLHAHSSSHHLQYSIGATADGNSMGLVSSAQQQHLALLSSSGAAVSSSHGPPDTPPSAYLLQHHHPVAAAAAANGLCSSAAAAAATAAAAAVQHQLLKNGAAPRPLHCLEAQRQQQDGDPHLRRNSNSTQQQQDRCPPLPAESTATRRRI